jgi:hypothetical protein
MNGFVRGSLWMWSVFGLVAVVIASANGCFAPEDTFVNYQRTSTVTTTGAGGGGGGDQDLSPREFFEQNVKDKLIANCSGSDCHSSGVRAFLLIGQEYASITTYRTSTGLPLIFDPPENSQLIVYPDDEEHPGKSWEGIEDVRDVTLEWLQREAVDIEPDAFLQLGPVKPEGLTVLPMDSLLPELEGFTLSFYAVVFDDSVLELTNISIWPPNERGLKVVDPTWVVIPPGTGDEVLDTSHHGDHTFVAPNDVTLASGELLVTTWGPDYELAVRFESLQALFADDEGNTFVPCSEPELFVDGVDALPVQSQSNAPNGLLYCAEQCHGGNAGSQPTDEMDLAALLRDPRDDELACAKVREHIVPTQPAESPIITLTDPNGTATHPFSFGGNSSSHTQFREAMTEWINQEGGEE